MSGDFFRENWLFLFTMIFTIKADAELSKCDFVMMGFLNGGLPQNSQRPSL